MRGAFVITLIAVSTPACFGSDATQCANGITCPRATVCDQARDRCVPEGQRDACNGLDDGDECTFLGASGFCDDDICAASICGNGLLDDGETCDDGNNASGDGCRDDCLSDERCGGGVVDAHLGEECDCGDGADPENGCQMVNSDDPGALCRSDCLLHCGDGVINSAEDCDGGDFRGAECVHFGFDAGSMSCSASCNYSLAGCREIGWRLHSLPTDGSDLLLHSDGELYATTAAFFLERFEGQIWQEVARSDVGDFMNCIDSAGDDLVIGSSSGVVLRYDGQSLSREATGSTSNITEVRGFSATDVFVVAGNQVLRGAGASWAATGINIPTAASGLDGVAATDLYATAANQGLLHFDGASWANVDLGVATVLMDVWVRAADSAYAVGDTIHHFDGSWRTIDTGLGERALAVGGDSRFTYIFGNSAAVFGDGDQWASLPDDPVVNLVRSVAIDGRGHLHVVGIAQDPARLPGNLYKPHAITSVEAVWTFDFDDAIAVGFGPDPVRRYDGHQWSDDPAFTDSVNLSGVFARSRSEIYVVGGDRVYRYDGVMWQDIFPGVGGETFHSIAGNDDVLYVGGTLGSPSSGAIWRFDGQWAQEPIADQGLFAVLSLHVLADGTALATQGTLLRRDAGVWREEKLGDTDFLLDVWGSAAFDLWAVGQSGGAHHFDGSAWTAVEVAPLTFDSFTAIDGTARDDVFLTSSGGNLFHFDGERWSPVRVPSSLSFNDISVTTHSVHATSFTEAVEIVRLVPWN